MKRPKSKNMGRNFITKAGLHELKPTASNDHDRVPPGPGRGPSLSTITVHESLKADTSIDSESDVYDEVDTVPPLSPVITPQEKEAIVKDKNIIGHINGEMAEILLDFVTAADETLNDDCKFPDFP